MHRFLCGSATLAVCLAAPAQDFLGFGYNTAAGAASRGTLGNAAGEVITRIDGDECAGFGTGLAGHRTLRSIACIVQDANAATAETFDIVLYPEDPARAGFPDLSAGVPFAVGVPGPSGQGGVAEVRLVTPTAPVAVPIRGGGDLFVSFVLPTAAPADGLQIQVVLGFQPSPAFAVYDTPGPQQGGTPVPAGSPATSHFLTRSGSTLTYNARRQAWLDVAHDGAGGVGLVITNQPSFPSSHEPPPSGFGPAPGTGDFLSGSAPDLAGHNPGRADDLAMVFHKAGVGTGRLVVFLQDRDLEPRWGPELPVGTWFAGATGSTCLVDPQIVAFVATTDDEAFFVTRLPAAVRGALAGLCGKQQAAGFDGNGVLHATACDAVRF